MSKNRESLDRAIACWNAGDLDGYLNLYDAGIRLHGYSPEPMDKAGVTEFYRMIFAALPQAGKPNPELDILDVVEAGDQIACRFVMTGVHSGSFMNIPASGRPYALPGITILNFSNGKTIERWSSADMLGLLIQIGAIPAP
jgi:predicted ester cyclase